jgi:hypothetical protein
MELRKNKLESLSAGPISLETRQVAYWGTPQILDLPEKRFWTETRAYFVRT